MGRRNIRQARSEFANLKPPSTANPSGSDHAIPKDLAYPYGVRTFCVLVASRLTYRSRPADASFYNSPLARTVHQGAFG